MSSPLLRSSLNATPSPTDKTRAFTTRASFSNYRLLEALESRSLFSANPVTQFSITQQPSTVADNNSDVGPIKVQLQDANGAPVSKDHGTLRLSILTTTATGATILGNITAKAKNGTATFNHVFLDAPGTYTLAITKGNVTVDTDSFGVKGLVFTQIPTSTNDSTPFALQVSVENSNGTVDTSDSSNITLKLNNAPRSTRLNGTLHATASAGVATFSGLSIARTGNVTFSASNSDLSAQSHSFPVNPSLPTKLKIVSIYPVNHPGITIPGQLGPVVVDILDANGNLATNFTSGSGISPGLPVNNSNNSNGSNGSNGSSNGSSNSTSNLTIAPTITLTLQTTLNTETTLGTLTIPLTITQNATNGVAVFTTTALTVQTPGFYRLTVSAGTLFQQSELIFIR